MCVHEIHEREIVRNLIRSLFDAISLSTNIIINTQLTRQRRNVSGLNGENVCTDCETFVFLGATSFANGKEGGGTLGSWSSVEP